ncbi:tetratricopeptide repeat protein [Dinghuibacter silviterrae]|uniref:Tetratricopeptide repeat protein n=1 Tax=Dinghuibacter silviterrae TaxID=1539049 RepID=A0A4R8DRF8_9BACT|nr:tetratricopeptide repeat protein [Dinghuibacter silviterrae]TDX00416.1 tetratricopeptide repeat protein [Dinghuibacter silviterrae]
MRIYLTVLLIGLSFTLHAQKVFDFNAPCQEAYHDILCLKIDAGQRLIDAEKKAHPNNLIPYFLENYVDFLVLFINEDPAEYERRAPHKDERLALMTEGPENSPFYGFTRAIINFQWAAIEMKFGGNVSAGWAGRKSFLQIKDNEKEFPDFSPNQMIYGAMKTVLGAVPDGYKWFTNLLGMKGSVRDGMAMVGGFISKHDAWANLFKDEGIFYYTYLKFYILNQHDEVFRFIEDCHLDTVNNLLFAYMVANLALNDQRADVTEAILRARNTSPEYMATPVWDMEMGCARLCHQQKDANVYLERYLAAFKGRFYVKDIIQKLSWYYYLEGNMPMASHYRKEVLTRGSAHTEADKNALRDAQLGVWPNKLLLEARLLSDGGYHKEAFQVLQGKTTSDFPTDVEKLEFSYRLGRIYDDLGRQDDAIKAYLVAVKLGEHRQEYFASRAAWQIGYIYERRGNKNMAVAFYQKCIDMPDHEYKNSMDQRAKAGIARCNGS